MKLTFCTKLFVAAIFAFGLFLQTVAAQTIDPTSIVRNHSIKFFSTNSREVPCVYCTDEYYSHKSEAYLNEECRKEYIHHQNESKIVKNNSIYHRICVPFLETEKYKSDVQCPNLQNFENGNATLLKYYFTADDQPPATITEPIVGTQLMIVCDPGYITYHPIVECSVVNNKPKWYPQTICLRIGCFGIPHPENGISSCDKDIVDNGTLCNITCKSGYKPNREYTQCLEREYTHNLSCVPIPVPQKDNGTPNEVIIGSIIGVVVLVIIMVIFVIILCKRYRKNKKDQLILVGDQGGQDDSAAENGRSNGVVSPSNDVRNGQSNGIRNGQSNGVRSGAVYKKEEGAVRLNGFSGSPQSSLILPELSPSSLESNSTKTSGLPSGTPSNVQSPSDDERSPLMPKNEKVFTDKDSPGQPVQSIIEHRTEDTGSEVTEPEDTGSVVTGSEVTEPEDTGSEVTVPGVTVKESSDGGNNTVGVQNKKKIPVENEYIDREVLEASTDQAKQAIENDDFSALTTLNSTGSDLLDMAAGGDDTVPKEILEDDQTNPKVLSDMPPVADRPVPSLLSNPQLADFGFNEKDSDVERFNAQKLANKELTSHQVDGAYGSNECTLESNPTRLLADEEGKGQGQVADQDTGRGTMDMNLQNNDH